MAYTKPEYGKAEVDAAGAIIIDPNASADSYEKALIIVDNWRASHNFPLNTMQMWLRSNAKKIDPKRIVAQRIKRLSSIKHKLQRMPSVTLSDMQDIGGCRAIVKNIECVNEILALYKKSNIRHELERLDDYIKYPKIRTGYRSVHLIYNYISDKNTTYNGHKIEIQLRTPLQHAWATAVETVGTFKGQVLKSNQGDADLLRFFKLMATVMAKIEGTPPAPKTPTSKSELQKELNKYTEQIDIIKHITTYGEILQNLQVPKNSHYFLLTLDPENKQVNVKGFHSRDLKIATNEYLKIEKGIGAGENIDAVLVSVESLSVLERAYPNYFFDMKVFITILDKMLMGKL